MNLFKKLKGKINQMGKIANQVAQLQATLGKVQEALGRIESRQLQTLDSKTLSANEFRVFSQWGEDGIILNPV